MHYLIDGHNLIAKLPDIDLSDPDDEVKLVLRLREWTAVSPKRIVTVYFDGGIPGGHNVNLSNAQVKVIFVSAGKTADALLIARINRVKNPPEYVLVTTDQEIIAAAKKRKMKHMRSEKFAMRLGSEKKERSLPGPTITDEDPVISEAEVAEWLNMFGPVDEKALRRRPKLVPPNRIIPEPEPDAPEEANATPKPPASSDRENPELSDAELEEWLTIFGGQARPDEKQKPETAEKKTAQKAKPRSKKKKSPNPQNLSNEDLAAWNAYFGQDD